MWPMLVASVLPWLAPFHLAAQRPGTFAVVTVPLPRLDARFQQVYPVPFGDAVVRRSAGQVRAVVLLHGFQLHIHQEKVAQASMSSWQKPESKLVVALAPEADVFAFAYSQNVPIDAVGRSPVLIESVRQLKESGYQEIVLIGHSAGGLAARHFVEDHPGSGVTRVIQICSPNTGCGYARLDWLCKNQRAFVDSLGKPVRRRAVEARADRRIPDHVEFLCVIGAVAGIGDFVVSDVSQWPKDLQEQGIPAIRWLTGHFWVTRNRADAQKIVELVRTRHPRWDAAQVAVMKKKLLGD